LNAKPKERTKSGWRDKEGQSIKEVSLLKPETPSGKNLYARTEKRPYPWKMGDHFYREESKTI
jgi:hypothetical protein